MPTSIKRLFLTFIFGIIIITFVFSQKNADSLKQILLSKTIHDTIRLQTLNKLAFEVYLRGNTDSALKYSHLQLDYSIIKKYPKYEAQAYNTIGTAYSLKEDFFKAKENIELGLALRIKIGDKGDIAKSYGSLGVLYKTNGNFNNALENYFKGLKMVEELKKEKEQATFLLNIGIIYSEMKEHDDALKYYKKSLDVFTKIDNKIGIASCYNTIANNLKNMGKYSEAITNVKKSLEIFTELNDNKGLSAAYATLGSLYIATDSIKEGIKCHETSLSIRKKMVDNKGIISSLNNLGDLYIKQGSLSAKKGDKEKANANYHKAMLFGEQALVMLEKENTSFDKKNTFEVLYKSHRNLKHAEKALEFFEKYSSLKDSLENNEKRKAILKQQYKYDYEKQALADSITYAKNSEVKNIELAKQKVEIKAKRNQTFGLIGGLIVVLIFSVLVFNRYKITNRQKAIIEKQKDLVENKNHIIEEKQKEIFDSISYAKRLQEAILPPQEFVNKHLAQNFIYYQPKDIVAGDFYWAEKVDDLFFIAAADSTGHGVPGAMVSVVCSNALNRAIKEFKLTETGKILDKTRDLVIETFEKSANEVKDGMDISLLCIDIKNKNIFWSGANNPLWFILDNEFKEIKADKQPIGKTDYSKPFTTHQIEFKENTSFYLFTDGFADQFGGPNGKKFKYKQFSDLLVKNTHLSQTQQADIINKAFTDWKGDLEQVDDVCVIGIKI